MPKRTRFRYPQSNKMESLPIFDDLKSHSTSSTITEISETTRSLLIILTTAIILLGLLGNGFVLYASLIYRAINIDRVSILLIENLAIADFLVVMVEFLPMLITLCANDWVMGQVSSSSTTVFIIYSI